MADLNVFKKSLGINEISKEQEGGCVLGLYELFRYDSTYDTTEPSLLFTSRYRVLKKRYQLVMVIIRKNDIVSPLLCKRARKSIGFSVKAEIIPKTRSEEKGEKYQVEIPGLYIDNFDNFDNLDHFDHFDQATHWVYMHQEGLRDSVDLNFSVDPKDERQLLCVIHACGQKPRKPR